MKLKELLNMYDNWNGVTVVNDDKLNPITKATTVVIAENERLGKCEVVSFGFYDNEFCVRVKF